MTLSATWWAFNQTTGDPVAKLVLVLMGDGVSEGNLSIINRNTVCELAEITPAALDKVLAYLTRRGLILLDPDQISPATLRPLKPPHVAYRFLGEFEA